MKISKTTLKNAADVGLSVTEDEIGGVESVNIRNAENSMIYCSYRNYAGVYVKQDLTTMNAEDFEKIPDRIESDTELNEAVLTVGDALK